jgi:hypothetical protein
MMWALVLCSRACSGWFYPVVASLFCFSVKIWAQTGLAIVETHSYNSLINYKLEIFVPIDTFLKGAQWTFTYFGFGEGEWMWKCGATWRKDPE